MKKYSLFIAWLVAAIGTGTSLYFSEMLQYVPCNLCWYQRIFLFPLVLLLAIALIRRDHRIGYYALPMSIIGGLIAGYQYALQKLTIDLGYCTEIASCTTEYINLFGFITIPLLSFLAFLIISLSLISALKWDKRNFYF